MISGLTEQIRTHLNTHTIYFHFLKLLIVKKRSYQTELILINE